jgi:hypothetical protein
LAWFESFQTQGKQSPIPQQQENGNLTLEQILDTIMQGRLDTQATYFITDYRCLEHADFINGQHLNQRCKQRDVQPENSDRLRVLVDKQRGVISQSKEFAENKFSSLVFQEAASFSKMVDILKVHDYSYIQRMI